jgi:hypothetical protein
LSIHAAEGGESLNSYHYVAGSLLQARDPVGLDAVVLHGGGPGGPGGVERLGEHVRQLMSRSDPDGIKEHRPSINYEDSRLPFANNVPFAGQVEAETHHHESDPKILAGFSIGGDAALRTGRPRFGGQWDLRVVVGARVDNPGEDFVGLLEKAGRTSERVVVVGFHGDNELIADGPTAHKVAGEFFGNRSYEGMVAAIEERYGSLQEFYKQNPNIVIEGAFSEHAGGGNNQATLDAVTRGYEELERRRSGAGSQPGEASPAASPSPSPGSSSDGAAPAQEPE